MIWFDFRISCCVSTGGLLEVTGVAETGFELDVDAEAN
jgi:hypothetical protein